MGLGFFRTAAIAGGAAADVIRVADEKREIKFNDALNDFVDNNVPKFMEARQKRVGIKNKLGEQLKTVVSRFIKPAVGENVGVNSQYELAEKLLFDNGGKISNIDAKYTYEMMNSAAPKAYSATKFIEGYFNGMPKGKESSRTIDQILTSRANQLAPDPTIDIQGKAEALAGYKDSVFFKMDRNTVAERLKSATGYTGPVETTTNPYSNLTTGLPSADVDIIDQRKSRDLSQESTQMDIDTKEMVKKIGQYKQGVIQNTFDDFTGNNYIINGVKANRDLPTGKFIPIMDKPKLILLSHQDAIAQTINKTLMDQSFQPAEPSKSKLNVIPDLTNLVRTIPAKKFPLLGDSPSKINWSEVKVGAVYKEKGTDRKFIYYAMDSNNPSIVDVDKKYYFDR